MSSIPLPALDVRPPQATDPLQAFGQLVALRNSAQEAQLRQQQVQIGQQDLTDRQAMTTAWQNWDGKSPDSLIKSVLDNGGSGAAANQLSQQMMARQAQHMALDKDSLELQQKRTDRLLGRFDAAKGVSDDQLVGHVQQATQESLEAGDIQPQEAQAVGQMLQQYQGNPQGLRDQLDTFEKGHMLDSQIQARAKEASETAKNQAEAQKTQQESAFYQRNPTLGAPGVPAETVSMADFLRKNPNASPSDYQAYKSAQTARAEAPYRVQAAAAEGTARASTEVNMKRQELSDTQYQQAISADQRLTRMETSYKDASNGNQQAMLALLTDHIGMTLGLQKGARITKDIINEAAQSQPWLAGLRAKFDSNGYLSGITLSQTQMQQMMSMGYSQRENAWDTARQTSSLYNVAPPPNANAVYNRRDPNARVFNQQGNAPSASDYKPGFVRNGYRFKGGDPTQPANWVKQ